jgi:hypothetical protein
MGETPQQDPRSYVFGFGRRICPGRQLGETSLFLLAATCLATLHIAEKLGANGAPIKVAVEYTNGSVMCVLYYKWNIVGNISTDIWTDIPRISHAISSRGLIKPRFSMCLMNRTMPRVAGECLLRCVQSHHCYAFPVNDYYWRHGDHLNLG